MNQSNSVYETSNLGYHTPWWEYINIVITGLLWIHSHGWGCSGLWSSDDALRIVVVVEVSKVTCVFANASPNSKVHGANMGPICGQQVPCGLHVSPMKFAIWVIVLTKWLRIKPSKASFWGRFSNNTFPVSVLLSSSQWRHMIFKACHPLLDFCSIACYN